MKTLCAVSLLVCAASPAAWSETRASAAPMRDAATHEQLVNTYRKTSQEDPLRNMKQIQGEDPSVVNRPKDIISDSDIISFNGLVTLVPKRAILNIPAKMADRLKLQPGAKLLGWAAFYEQNRGWITTVEVTRAQAEGNKPFDEMLATRIGKSTNLVVATYQGGPISVLPLKVEDQTPVKK
ncbi:MAG: hypothetical protein ABI162_00150 [Luteolibacter sp.]